MSMVIGKAIPLQGHEGYQPLGSGRTPKPPQGGTGAVRPSEPSHLGKWQSIDWAMRSISIAAHLCFISGLVDLSDELLVIHQKAMARRDRA